MAGRRGFREFSAEGGLTFQELRVKKAHFNCFTRGHVRQAFHGFYFPSSKEAAAEVNS